MSSFTASSVETINVSGLAGEIRSSLVSDQFDLGGYTEQRAHDLIHNAFGTPLPAPNEMVKFTFIVGGGKLVRSRYPEDLSKWLVSALREIGFQEDRSAAETYDSQGTYKQQHDTGQNLKYLIVYPKILKGQATSTSSQQGESTSATSSEPVLNFPANSPENLLLTSELSTFQDMIHSKVSSYSQKKKVLKFLQDQHAIFQQIEQKLISATQVLSSQEQLFYENNSGQDLEKINFLQQSIKEMIEQGKLTPQEKKDLLQHLETNITTTKEELEAAKQEVKPKKIEKLEIKLQNLLARKEAVTKPIAGESTGLPRLKHGQEISSLYCRLFPLLSLEEKSRSMSLTLQDLKALEEKTDIQNAIHTLEISSREWFVDDEVFAAMCAQEEKLAKQKYQKQKQNTHSTTKKPSSGVGGSAGGTGKAGSSVNSWATIGVKKPSSSSAGKGNSTAKKSSFAGLDDDSD